MKTKITLFFIFIGYISYSQNGNLNFESSAQLYEEKNAEQGYIITKNNEYKEGIIIIGTEKDNSQYIKYLKHAKDKITKYKVTDILEYGYGDIVYSVKKRENNYVFMQRLNKKEPFIYYYKSRGKKEFYVQKDNNSFALLSKNKKELKKELAENFISCQQFQDQIYYSLHKKNRLKRLSRLYDNCNNKRLTKLRVGGFGGVLSSGIILNDMEMFSFDAGSKVFSFKNAFESSTVSSNFGFYLDLPISHKNEYWYFHPEISFTNCDYTLNDDGTKAELNFNFITTNLFFRFNSMNKKIAFYTDFGPSISSISKKEIIVNDFGRTYVDGQPNLNNILYGLGANIGIEIPVSNIFNFNIGAKANYLLGNAMPNTWRLGGYIGINR